jgi:hypothetical protein
MTHVNELEENLRQKKTELAQVKTDKAQALQNLSEHTKFIGSTAPGGPLKMTATAATRSAAAVTPAVETARKQVRHNAQQAIDLVAVIARLEAEIAGLEQQLDAPQTGQAGKRKKTSPKQKRAAAPVKKATEQVTVLFLAANALKNAPLQLDAEARAIQDNIRRSEHRESINFVTRWATQPLDILQAINEVNPQVVHFSGHGSENDQLVLQGDDGKPKYVRLEAIVQVMLSTSDTIRLVFFNVCFSDDEAEAVVNYIEAAIGMKTAIGDDAARVFAAQFYSALGFGKSLKTAFAQAKAALMLQGIAEENTPQLYVKEGLDPAQIVLVKA